MKIIIYSSVFSPLVGGMESVAEQLAFSFNSLGHQVILVTPIAFDNLNHDSKFPFTVKRGASFLQRFKYARSAGVILHNSISLKALFPDFLFTKKIFVIHHSWYYSKEKITIPARIKLALSKFTHNIFISEAIARHVNASGIVIGNPFNSLLFRRLQQIDKTRDVVFLGRLVSDKGCDLLIRAIEELKLRNIHLSLTIIGDGPELNLLLNQCEAAGIASSVSFVGSKRGSELVELLNQHSIMVIPSLWDEPFGLVALEGMACGCFVIGSDGGGLKEAIGRAGLTFRNGDLQGLIGCLQMVLDGDPKVIKCMESRMTHLYNHSEKTIAENYIRFFHRTTRGE